MMDSSSTKLLLSTNRVATTPQLVKTFDAGLINSNGYGSFTGFAPITCGDGEVSQSAAEVPPERRKRVIIVGAGVSGVQQATVLLRDGYVKHNDIQIFDALDDYGGVWRKNTYPGCACDVPAMIYTTSYHVCRSLSSVLSLISDHLLTTGRQNGPIFTRRSLRSKSTMPNSPTNIIWRSVRSSSPSSSPAGGTTS